MLSNVIGCAWVLAGRAWVCWLNRYTWNRTRKSRQQISGIWKFCGTAPMLTHQMLAVDRDTRNKYFAETAMPRPRVGGPQCLRLFSAMVQFADDRNRHAQHLSARTIHTSSASCRELKFVLRATQHVTESCLTWRLR